MGLADRHYMRQAGRDFRWSATLTVIVINIVAFVLQNTALRTVHLERYAYLSLDGLQHGYVWQLLTFQLLHQGFLHILFNSLAIYFFGRPVEMVIGRSRFFTLYFGSGIVGGLTHALFALTLPQFNAAVVGASAGAFGLLAAFAVINWHEQFTLLFYFILPLRMRGRTFFWAALILTVISLSMPGGSVAYTAHLGGLLAGFGWIKLGWHHDYRRLPWEGWFARLRGWRPFGSNRYRQRELVKTPAGKMHRWPISKAADSPEPPEEEFISREVDPILDKISAHGIQSLSPRERQILEAARKKMERR